MAALTRDRPGLRLLRGGAEDVLQARGWDAPPPLARPADRCDPWPVDPAAVEPLAGAARRRGIAFELAAVVTVERALIGQDLDVLGLADRTPFLDADAASAAVTRELSEPASAYLAALDRSGQVHVCTGGIVALPTRLRERIASHSPAMLLEAELLEYAIAWERAALLAGRTMSEWALLALAATRGY
jgi:hypothetical protein